MKVTGYMLRDAIKEHTLRRDTAAAAFSKSLMAFPGEEKDPQGEMAKFQAAESAIAILETAQIAYNMNVRVEVLGATMPLSQAIKLIGGAGRIEKMWKDAIADKSSHHYLSDSDVRDPNQIRATRTVPSDEALALARAAGKRSNALRAAIATANGKELDITDLDPSLLE